MKNWAQIPQERGQVKALAADARRLFAIQKNFEIRNKAVQDEDVPVIESDWSVAKTGSL